MSLNIYNPTTQQLTEVAGLDVKDSLEKVATLPTPTADYLNQVYILVGTQAGYHVGSIYQCRYINSAYTWVEITGSVVDKADKAPNATNNHLAKLTADGNLADSGIAVGDLGTAINKNWTDLVRPNSHDLVESNAVYSAITNAISSIYTPHGDITCAELVPALLIEENIGNVYTVTDSGTTTAYFMQGAGKTINTGDSVSIIKAGENTILFNLMGNVLDLTGYHKKNLSTVIEIGGVDKTTVEDALNGLNDHEEEDIEGIWKANNVLGAKNLLPNNGETNTRQGVIFTKNNDGSVTVSTNEPAITNTWYMLVGLTNGDTSYPMVDGDYILSTTNSLPSGVRFIVKTDESTVVAQIDAGENKEPFTLSGNKSISVGIRVAQGTEITTPITIYPMIRLATDPDDTYQPYAMTNRELTVTSYTDNSVYASRTSKGDLVDMSLIGGTVGWNQLAQELNSTNWNDSDVNVSYSNGIASFTATAQFGQIYQSISGRIANHKYLFLLTAKANTSSAYDIKYRIGAATVPSFSLTNSWQTYGYVSAETTSSSNLSLVIFDAHTSNWVQVDVKNPMFIDLTQMFGTEIADYIYSLEQANAGDGVAWFRQYFPNDYYDYNAGALLSVNTKGRKITSSSESTTYAIEPIDLRGIPKLVDNKLNYDGDIYKSNGAITRKYGIVDLGTLDWQYSSPNQRFITNDLRTLIKSMPYQNLANLFCARYVSSIITDTNRIIWNGWGGQINIIDTDYTDTTLFKASLSGVYLVYELATQTTEIVSPYINPQRVYDGGTEEFLRDSAPIIPVGVKAEYYNNKTSVLATEYTDSVGNSKVDWKSNSLIGVKNLNGTIYSTKTHYGIDFTANSDGTVTANGTSTGSAQDGNDTGAWFVAPFSAQVILSGGISTTAHIYPWDNTDNARPYIDSTQTSRIDSGSDSDGSNEVSFYMVKGHSYGMVIRILNGTTVSNAIFKPLLRLASDPDNTYVPYAKTNQELSYNNFNESVVNITSYDTDSNKYVCPCDGYAYMYMSSTNGSGGFIYIYGATGTNRIQIGTSVASTGTYPSFCTFVKKGMRLQTHDIVGGGKAYFRPLD